MNTTWTHTTVLLEEAVEALVTRTDATYVDATFGRGGHTSLILSKLSDQAHVIAFDKDPDAVAVAQNIHDKRLSIRHEGFKHINELPANSAAGRVVGLGIKSPKNDNPARGIIF